MPASLYDSTHLRSYFQSHPTFSLSLRLLSHCSYCGPCIDDVSWSDFRPGRSFFWGAGQATLVLDTPDDKLDDTTRKLKTWCLEDFQNAQRTGLCGKKLWCILKIMSRILKCDVQENEGVNSLITFITGKARNITLPLLSARVVLKKALGLGTANANERWSKRRDRARTVLQRLVDHIKGTAQVLSEPDRWDIPKKSTDVPSTRGKAMHSVDPRLRNTPDMLWAIPFNLVMHHKIPKPTADKCIIVGEPREGGKAYICADKLYSIGTCAEFILERNGTHVDGRPKLEMSAVLPLKFVSTQRVLADWFSTVNPIRLEGDVPEELAPPANDVPVNLHKVFWYRKGSVNEGKFRGVVYESDPEPAVLLTKLETAVQAADSENKSRKRKMTKKEEPEEDSSSESEDECEKIERMAKNGDVHGLSKALEVGLPREFEAGGLAGDIELQDEDQIDAADENDDVGGDICKQMESKLAKKQRSKTSFVKTVVDSDPSLLADQAEAEHEAALNAHLAETVIKHPAVAPVAPKAIEELQANLQSESPLSLTDTDASKILDDWLLDSQRGLDALRYMRALGPSTAALGEGNYLSMVAVDKNVPKTFDAPEIEAMLKLNKVVFIHWLDARIYSGIVVRLDKFDKVIWATRSDKRSQPVNMSGNTVIMRSIDIKMVMSKTERQQIGPDILHLKKMWEAALHWKSRELKVFVP